MTRTQAATEHQTNRPGRRGFLATMGGLAALWAGVTLYPVYRYLRPRPAPDPFGGGGQVKADGISSSDVAAPGSSKAGGYAGRGLVVFRTSAGRLRAFDTKCSHAGCNVRFEGTRFICPCHNGIYDLDGKNISGPPPRPLVELSVTESDGMLFVSRLGAQEG